MRTCSGLPPRSISERADGGVGEAEEQQGLGRQAVAAGAPRLLVVALEVLGQVVVARRSARRACRCPCRRRPWRRPRATSSRAKAFCTRSRSAGRQAGVVGGGRHAGRRQARRRPLRCACARGSRRCRPRRRARATNAQELVGGLALVDHGVADVGPVEAGDEDRARRRGRGGRARRRASAASAVAVQAMSGTPGNSSRSWPSCDVLGAEVVAPLRDAVGLVDGEEGDAGVRSRAPSRARAGARGSRRS